MYRLSQRFLSTVASMDASQIWGRRSDSIEIYLPAGSDSEVSYGHWDEGGAVEFLMRNSAGRRIFFSVPF